MPFNQPIDQETRSKALRLAEELGVEEASRQTGVRSNTIVSWRRREARKADPNEATSTDREDAPALSTRRLERRLTDTWDAAGRLLKASEAAHREGRSVDAKNYSISYAVMTDKCAKVLADHLQKQQAGQAQLSEDDAKLVEAVLTAFCDALGVPLVGPARQLLVELVQGAQDGEVKADEKVATAARKAVEEHVARRLPKPERMTQTEPAPKAAVVAKRKPPPEPEKPAGPTASDLYWGFRGEHFSRTKAVELVAEQLGVEDVEAERLRELGGAEMWDELLPRPGAERV